MNNKFLIVDTYSGDVKEIFYSMNDAINYLEYLECIGENSFKIQYNYESKFESKEERIKKIRNESLKKLLG